MAKEPQVGQVKTRLAQKVGDQKALEFYREFCVHIQQKLSSVSFDWALAFSPGNDDLNPPRQLREIFTPHFFVAQSQGNLGERLQNLFARFCRERRRKVVIIGTDSPDLPLDYLNQAFLELDSADVVIGPTEDGGYYLIGLCEEQPEIFENIHWSTSTVFEETQLRAQEKKLSLKVLPQWYDIDELEDLHRYQKMQGLPLTP